MARSRFALATPTAASASAVADDLVELLAADGLAGEQAPARFKSASSRLKWASLWPTAASARELGLVGPGVDLEEDVALLDLVAVLEVDLLEVAGDAGPDLDHLHGGGLPDQEVLVVGDLADDRLSITTTGGFGGGDFAGA